MAINKKKRFFFDLAQDEEEQELNEDELKINVNVQQPKSQVQQQTEHSFKQSQQSKPNKFTVKETPTLNFGPIPKFQTKPFEPQVPKSEPVKPTTQEEYYFFEPQQATPQPEYIKNPPPPQFIRSNPQPVQYDFDPAEPQFVHPDLQTPKQSTQQFQPKKQESDNTNLPPPKMTIQGIIPLERQERLNTGVHFYTSPRVWEKVKRYSKTVNIPISRILTMILDRVIEE